MQKLIFFILAFCFYHISFADTLTVCASGCDHTTILAAVGAANPSDIIDIGAETFTEANINITIDLTIQGQGQSSTIVQAAATQGAATDAVFAVSNNITVIFQDLTIQNGNALSSGGSNIEDGGGVRILCNASSDVSFLRVTIANNRSEDAGGGVYITGNNGTVSFTDCVISDNEANNTVANSNGGGVHNIGASTCTFTRCTISGNTAGGNGGGIFINEASSSSLFINCTVYNNSAGSSNASPVLGGGIRLAASGTTHELINCTVVNNSMTGTGAIRRGGGVGWTSGDLTLTNTIIANNTGATSGNDFRGAGGTMTVNTTLIEDCDNCPTSATYTTDPNLAAIAFCGSQAYFSPQSPSDALDNGTAPAGTIPTDDICGNTRVAPHDLGSVDASAFVEVPTLSEWGLIVLALCLMITGTLYLVQKNEPLKVG